jgi:hypothetical protein
MLVSSGKGKKEHKARGVCWNCGEKGHFKDKCPKPVKDTKNDSPKKDEAACFVEGDEEFDEEFDDDDLPELRTVSDSDSEGSDSEPDGNSEGDRSSEIGDGDEGSGWETEELFKAELFEADQCH